MVEKTDQVVNGGLDLDFETPV